MRRLIGLWVMAYLALILIPRLGDNHLSVPLRSLDAFESWLRTAPPPLLAFALLRQGAILACGYLWLALTLQIVAGAMGMRRLARLAWRLLPLTLHHALLGGAGLSVAAAAGLSGGARPAAAANPAVVILWEGGPPEDTTASMTLLPPPPAPTLTMEALGPAPPAAVPPAAADPRPEEPTAASRQAEDTWQVRPGDSFWSIAHEVLVQDGEEHPSDEEVADYWRRLLRANGALLASSDHPDLLFPGQILEVPPP